MPKPVAISIALLSLTIACGPQRLHGQSFERPPSGVRRTAPVVVNRPRPAKVVRRREAPYRAASHGSVLDEILDLGPPMAEGAARHGDVKPVWYASDPNPSEPLGFSGAKITPPSPIDDVDDYVPVDDFVPAEEEFYAPTMQQSYVPAQGPMNLQAPAPATSSGEWVRDGCWYTQQSVIYMSASSGPKDEVLLATDEQLTVPSSQRPTLSIPNGYGWAPGLLSVLGRHIGRDVRNRDHSIEFTFLGLTHWDVAAGLQSLSGGGIITDIDPTFQVPAYNQSSFQSFDLVSSLNSYELNYRVERRLSRDQMVYTRDSTWVRRATPAFLPGMFLGLRSLVVNEKLTWLADSTVQQSTGFYQVRTSNRLFGPQIGGDLFLERSDWRVGARIKGAAVVNWASQSSDVRILDVNGSPIIPNRNEYAKQHVASFAGGFDFIGSYHLRPNFAMRFSYNLLWLSNQALARNQLTFNPGTPPVLASSNTLFFQGLTFGLEIVR